MYFSFLSISHNHLYKNSVDLHNEAALAELDTINLRPGEINLGVELVVLGVDVDSESVYAEDHLGALLVLHVEIGDPVGLQVLAQLQVLQHRLLPPS